MPELLSKCRCCLSWRHVEIRNLDFSFPVGLGRGSVATTFVVLRGLSVSRGFVWRVCWAGPRFLSAQAPALMASCSFHSLDAVRCVGAVLGGCGVLIPCFALCSGPKQNILSTSALPSPKAQLPVRGASCSYLHKPYRHWSGHSRGHCPWTLPWTLTVDGFSCSFWHWPWTVLDSGQWSRCSVKHIIVNFIVTIYRNTL